jgi:YVTN family beta-propeller protein
MRLDAAVVGRSVSLLLAALAAAPMPCARAASSPYQPLVLEASISLAKVSGRIDHMAVDLGRKRLLVAELGNDSVDVIDLTTNQAIHRIEGQEEPQGVAFAPAADLILIANSGDGSVRLLNGADFSEVGKIDLGSDADNIRIDQRTGQAIVGYGRGGLAVIDPVSRSKIAEIPLPAHPEGFQLAAGSGQIFVNIPDAREIAVVDPASAKQVATWKDPELRSNFPMAIDESLGLLASVYRNPARLVFLDPATGAATAKLEACDDADDVFVDAKLQRIYVSCGEGFIDVFQRVPGGFALMTKMATAAGARTSLFVPELDRLFLAVRASGSQPAAIWVFRPQP